MARAHTTARRALAAALTVALLVSIAGAAEPARADALQHDPWDRANRPARRLRPGSPWQAGLVAAHLDDMDSALLAGLEPSPDTPRFPGAVVLAARDGIIARHRAYGEAVRYADDAPTLLPADERIPMRPDTIFDLASITKLFTAVAILQLVEDGALDLDAPVADVIAEFGQAGKGGITIRHLLSHTSGLPAWAPLWSAYDTPEARVRAIYEMTPRAAPGETYVYSDLGLIVLGEIVETVTGRRLDEVIAERITGPLGMTDTMFNPAPALRDRIAATEYSPATGRGMVHGSVHDENAWALGGIAGHAGLFSTAGDLAVFAQMLLNGGRYAGARILEPETVQAMMVNQTAAFPGNDRGLGPQLYQHWYFDAMTTPASAGHTGFTGTSLVIDPTTDSFAILLTNRVHPSRSWASVNPVRTAVARAVGRAVAVRTRSGRPAWFSGIGDAVDHRLEVDVDLPDEAVLLFDVWYDTEPLSDVATVEVSTDGGTTWHALDSFTGWGGRRWRTVSLPLDGHTGPATMRWRYATDPAYSGRGVYVDRVRIAGPRGVVFDERRPADARRWRVEGWYRSRD
jgi:CubicO group peptidase (beta-lactamase class C family)